MNGCKCASAYIGAERICLSAALANNRCALSKKLGHPVADDDATRDFIDHLMEAFSRQFHQDFCGDCLFAAHCPARHVQIRPH